MGRERVRPAVRRLDPRGRPAGRWVRPPARACVRRPPVRPRVVRRGGGRRRGRLPGAAPGSRDAGPRRKRVAHHRARRRVRELQRGSTGRRAGAVLRGRRGGGGHRSADRRASSPRYSDGRASSRARCRWASSSRCWRGGCCPMRPGRRRVSLDAPALVAATIALAGINVALLQGEAWGWTSAAVVGAWAVAAVALAAFVVRERRRCGASRSAGHLPQPRVRGVGAGRRRRLVRHPVGLDPARDLSAGRAGARGAGSGAGARPVAARSPRSCSHGRPPSPAGSAPIGR